MPSYKLLLAAQQRRREEDEKAKALTLSSLPSPQVPASAGPASAKTTAKTAVETPAETAVSTTVEPTIESTARTTIPTTGDTPAETTLDTTAPTTIDTTTSTTVDTPVETTAPTAVDTTARTTVRTLAPRPVDTAVRTTAKTTVGTAARTTIRSLAGTTVMTTSETSADEPVFQELDETHTKSEQAVWGRMYRETIPKGREEKHFSFRHLSRVTKIKSDRTMTKAIHGLLAKKSIDRVYFCNGDPAGPRYRIYKPQDIFRRRREAGIEIDPDTARILNYGTTAETAVATTVETPAETAVDTTAEPEQTAAKKAGGTTAKIAGDLKYINTPPESNGISEVNSELERLFSLCLSDHPERENHDPEHRSLFHRKAHEEFHLANDFGIGSVYAVAKSTARSGDRDLEIARWFVNRDERERLDKERLEQTERERREFESMSEADKLAYIRLQLGRG